MQHPHVFLSPHITRAAPTSTYTLSRACDSQGNSCRAYYLTTPCWLLTARIFAVFLLPWLTTTSCDHQPRALRKVATGAHGGVREDSRKDPCSLKSPVLQSDEALALPQKVKEELIAADPQVWRLFHTQSCSLTSAYSSLARSLKSSTSVHNACCPRCGAVCVCVCVAHRLAPHVLLGQPTRCNDRACLFCRRRRARSSKTNGVTSGFLSSASVSRTSLRGAWITPPTVCCLCSTLCSTAHGHLCVLSELITVYVDHTVRLLLHSVVGVACCRAHSFRVHE